MEFYTETKDGFRFKVEKLPNDPMTNRLSVGGSKEEGCYVVYRGDTNDCLQVLKEAVQAMENAKLKMIGLN